MDYFEKVKRTGISSSGVGTAFLPKHQVWKHKIITGLKEYWKI